MELNLPACPRCGSDVGNTAQSCPSCGSNLIPTAPTDAIAWDEPNELNVIRQALAPDYEIGAEIGKGGMAVVYQAQERALEREVAVKVLPLSLSFDNEFVERFEHEARTAAQLEHPNIIPIYRVGRRGRVCYLVMKLLRGHSLSAVLKQRGKLPPAEISRLLVEVGSALGYAARRGVVHRDIKPDNILFDEHGHAVVTDFGIAKASSGPNLTVTGRTIGTPHYMSPEQARGQSVDGRSDIYSLGIVGYQCLVGMVPFDGDDSYSIGYQQIMAPLPAPYLRTAAERELFQLIRRMVAKNPGDRFANADELAAALTGGSGRAFHATEIPMPGRATVPLSGPPRASEAAKAQAAANLRQLRSEGTLAAYSAAAQAARAGVWLIRQGARTARWLGAQLPRLGSSLVTGTKNAAEALAAGLGGGRSLLVTQKRTVSRWVTSKGVSFWIAGGGLAASALAGYFVVHAQLRHRSRCSESAPLPSAAEAGDAAPFSVLVDSIQHLRQGDELDLYYDVCGLGSGDQYQSQLVITKKGAPAILSRLLGGDRPIRLTYDEQAKGKATRVHRSIELGASQPGSYRLELTVTGPGGGRRSETQSFQLISR